MSYSAALVMRATVAIIILQGFIILLWACCYRRLCFPSWNSAFYFSAASYSTVGYGDVVLPLKWRLLGPLESMMGVLMCGISGKPAVCAYYTLGPQGPRTAGRR